MSIFSKPYPKESNPKKKIITALFLGTFVFLFLIFYQPFSINLWHPDHKILRLFGYGIITSTLALFNILIVEKIFFKWFREENWKVWKSIAWSMWNILVIGIFNMLYSYWQGMLRISVSGFLYFQFITLLIGIFPVLIVTLMHYLRLQKRNLLKAQQLNRIIENDKASTMNSLSNETIALIAENGKDQITLNPKDLLALVAADNYVEVYYLRNNQLIKELLRNSIRNLEEALKERAMFFRCHRSYLVNLTKVVHVSGNSQGYKLQLEHSELIVPVSRSLNIIIRKKISDIHSIHPN